MFRQNSFVLPVQWLEYSVDVIEIVLFQYMRDHWASHNTIFGTTVTIENVTATIVDDQKDHLWFREIGDESVEPDEKYSTVVLIVF